MNVFEKIAKRPIGAFIPFGELGKRFLDAAGVCRVDNKYTAAHKGIFVEEGGLKISMAFARFNERAAGYEGFIIKEKIYENRDI